MRVADAGLFTDMMPFLSPIQQHQSTDVRLGCKTDVIMAFCV